MVLNTSRVEKAIWKTIPSNNSLENLPKFIPIMSTEKYYLGRGAITLQIKISSQWIFIWFLKQRGPEQTPSEFVCGQLSLWQRVDCSWWSIPRLENNPQCFPKRLFSCTPVFTQKHWENMSTAAWDSRASMETCILFIHIPKLREWGWDYGANWHSVSPVPPNRGKSKYTATH